MQITAQEMPRLVGSLKLPGDKSITHRAMFFASLCEGECEIIDAATGQDCNDTIRCLKDLGLTIEIKYPVVHIKSSGLRSLCQPRNTLEVGNSGTTMRLLTGLLAGANFSCDIDGDQSIRLRPMNRIFEPLELMGGKFLYLEQPDRAPFRICGAQLKAIDYCCPVASAQVETAFVLAALQAGGQSTIKLPALVRDHTQRLLQYTGVPVEATNLSVSVRKLEKPIAPFRIEIPGDLSSAAFLMVAAALLPGSELILPGVGINPGRRLIIDCMLKMGANLKIENLRNYGLEPAADIHVKYSPTLQGITISGAQIASGIDEIPVLALLGCFCAGTFCVQGATELRYKESNRLQNTIENLRHAGASVVQHEDGFEVAGDNGHVASKSLDDRLKGGCKWITQGDHRLAMTGIVAGLVSNEPIEVDNTECIKASYPAFENDLRKLLC